MKTCLLILAIFPVVCLAGGKRPERSAIQLAHTTKLPEFDRVRLYALRGMPRKGDEGFPILPYEGAVCEIIGEVELTGEQASEICDTWRRLDNDALGAMCHMPPYGFRFYMGDEMVFQTSVCWRCQNFYGPAEEGGYGWYGMAEDKNSSRLLKLCSTFLPHPDLKQKKDTAEQRDARGAARSGSRARSKPAATP